MLRFQENRTLLCRTAWSNSFTEVLRVVLGTNRNRAWAALFSNTELDVPYYCYFDALTRAIPHNAKYQYGTCTIQYRLGLDLCTDCQRIYLGRYLVGTSGCELPSLPALPLMRILGGHGFQFFATQEAPIQKAYQALASQVSIPILGDTWSFWLADQRKHASSISRCWPSRDEHRFIP